MVVSLASSYTTSQVRLTITDNYGGFDSLAYIGAGGDRVGLGELAFANLNTSVSIGDLDHTDSDSSQNDDVWQVVSTPTASTNAYGTYTIDASGLWTYTVDNNNSTVNALSEGETLADNFTALAEDGTSQVVTITINGSQEAPVAADDQTESGIEETVLTLIPIVTDLEGDALTITVDTVTETGTIVTGVTTVDANGNIIYTPTTDFDGEAVISYTVSDGRLSDTGLITVSLTGTDDPAIITGITETINLRILPDGTMTSSTNATDSILIGNGGLSDRSITSENYLTTSRKIWY